MISPLPNAAPRALARAKLIEYLIRYLEGKLVGMTDEECEALQQMMDNPPDHIPPEERADMMAAYYRRLTDADPKVRADAARAWSQWEGDTLSVRGPEGRPPKFEDDEFTVAFARIEAHYFTNGGFFPADNWLLESVERIRRIPTWIVQGRFDVVTPMESAWLLHKAWPEASFEVIWDAGHASTEPGIIDALVRATDAAY